MTVQEKIKNDLKVAMQTSNKEVRDLLRVVLGEFDRIGKELSDEQATAVIKKMVANANEMNNEGEANYLAQYLPKELSEHDLANIIQKIITYNGYDSMKDMGSIMGKLKQEHPNQYDGKLASILVKKALA
jgi:uncharacterized protein YqeY